MVEQAGEVFGMGAVEQPLRIRRHPKASLIHRDASVPSHEVRHLLPPRKMVPAEAVKKDEGKTFARGLVIEGEVPDRKTPLRDSIFHRNPPRARESSIRAARRRNRCRRAVLRPDAPQLLELRAIIRLRDWAQWTST